MVVRHYGLGVHIAVLIEIHLHPGSNHILDIGPGCQRRHYALVSTIRNHHPHVHSGKRCIAQGQQHRFRRNEVRRLDVDVLPALSYHLDDALHYYSPLIHRSGGGNLHQNVALGLHARVVTLRIEQLLRGELPVHQECRLHL